jgi:putative nucleotidyltransferase with HDIG domain
MSEKMKKRILFVDDEPMILNGLQRTLRRMRHEWEMMFVSSGPEALQILDANPMDVVVTDWKMPEMDGSQLLREIKNRHPHVVRIVLSGHVKHDMTLQSLQIAHQCLAKPCDAEILKQTLAKLFALKDLLSDESIKKIISQIDSLPSMPAIYSQIMEEMQSEDPSIKKVGDIIAQDASMTAKILQIVNSVFFGLSRKISSTQQAVMLLGLDTIKSLVLSVKIFAEFSRKKFSWFNIEDLFNHSMSVSCYAQAIVKDQKLERDLISYSLMAGILHDLGKLILATNFQQPYRQVLAEAQNSGLNLWDLEYEAFGTSHAEIGAYLMGLWNLDNQIIEAIAFHHRPAQSMARDVNLLTAVHIGNALDHNGHQGADQQPGPQYDGEYLDNLGVADRIQQWRQVCKELSERKSA